MFLSHRLGNGTVQSVCLHFGPNGCCLSFIHSRCLHDNHWTTSEPQNYLFCPRWDLGIELRKVEVRWLGDETQGSGYWWSPNSLLSLPTNCNQGSRRGFHEMIHSPENKNSKRSTGLVIIILIFLFSLACDSSERYKLSRKQKLTLEDWHSSTQKVSCSVYLSYPESLLLFKIKSDVVCSVSDVKCCMLYILDYFFQPWANRARTKRSCLTTQIWAIPSTHITSV